MAKAESKEVAVKDDPKLPATFDYGEDAGAGFEQLTRDDYTIPILDLLQAQSPEISTGSIEGAKPGMFIIRALGEVFDGKQGVAFVPCERQHAFVEWKPREAGGGIVDTYSPQNPMVVKEKQKTPLGKIKLENGNDLIETFYVFGILSTPDGQQHQVVLPFTSTKIAAYKGMMTKARSVLVPLPDGRRINPPLFAHRFRLRSEFKEKNGYKWFNLLTGFDGKNAEEARINPATTLYQDARAFHQLVKQGAVKADTSRQEQDAEDRAPQRSTDLGDDKDIPF